MDTTSFNAGVVCACDVVAVYGEGTILKEIIDACGGKEIYREIMLNGLEKTRKLAKFEFRHKG